MTRVKCLKCDTPMRKYSPSNMVDIYSCDVCKRTRMFTRKANFRSYESPSARRMRLGKENRLVDRWAKKGRVV